MMPEFCRQNDGQCYTLKKMAITFEDQFNEHAFINQPFTLEPKPASSHQLNSLKYMSIKGLLIVIIAVFIIVRRRVISAAIQNCFRSVKFISVR